MNQQSQKPSVFASKTPLPDSALAKRERTLLGFDDRYVRASDRLRLLLRLSELPKWSKRHHAGVVPLCDLIAEQYPLVIFHGDVGTGKTVTAECIANRLVAEAGEDADESILFKLSTRVRGSGKVGEMGTLITEAFNEVVHSAGKSRRAILIIDEGDSLAAKRSQEHSHHEDKVAVNTLIQHVDDLRQYRGRILVFLCTNRLGVLDAALMRRAALVEPFARPTDDERLQLFRQDLAGLGMNEQAFKNLTAATAQRNKSTPPWTFSDIRTRLYPSALAKAFPDQPLTLHHLLEAAEEITPSPVMEDA
jgi:SpoVK/Ycf46/Vps4 family AAA+-type ATPase